MIDTRPSLSQRALQRAVLARQQLLERAPELTSLATLLSSVAGLQTQYAPTAYIGLWSRLDGFERADLTKALDAGDVVQATLLRGTIHVVAAEDYWPMRLATIDLLRRWFRRRNGVPTERTVRLAADRVRTALEHDGRLTRKQLDEIAGKAGLLGVGLWVGLLRVPPSGTWERRRADLFADARAWLGEPPAMTVAEAREHLVRRYLTGFGPASVQEIASFAGANVGDMRDAAERVARRRFRADDGTDLLDLEELPVPDGDADAPVRFLGNWEALLLVHARRALVIREEDRPRIFTSRLPQSLPTFLVDGQVAGTWKYVDERIELDPWRDLSRREQREVAAEAERVADLHT